MGRVYFTTHLWISGNVVDQKAKHSTDDMPFSKGVMEDGCCQRMKVRRVIITGQSSVTVQYTPQIRLKQSEERRCVRLCVCFCLHCNMMWDECHTVLWPRTV